MQPDVDDIVSFWENTGLLYQSKDRPNLAMLLHTQSILNKKSSNTFFNKMSIPLLTRLSHLKPYFFIGLIDTSECVDVHRLGDIAQLTEKDFFKEILKRIFDLKASFLYFGGLVVQDEQLYLLTIDEEENV
jgi:hypothetical protein